MKWVWDELGLRDFIVFVMIYAPDRFPVEDYLPAEKQLNLDRAFAELRTGLEYSSVVRKHPTRRQDAEVLLDDAYRALVAGDRRTACGILGELQKLLGYDLKTLLRSN